MLTAIMYHIIFLINFDVEDPPVILVGISARDILIVSFWYK